MASKSHSKLPIRLRRLIVQRQEGDTITLSTNDLERSAVDIAQLYKGRWQIELLFRWIKQHLKIRKFLGYNDNAIRLQLFAAMIAFALLSSAARNIASIFRSSDLPILSCNACSIGEGSRHRQTSTSQSKSTKRPNIARSDRLCLCLFFPRTALPAGGRSAGRTEGGVKERELRATAASLAMAILALARREA